MGQAMLNEDQWKQVWTSTDGKKFRLHLGLMFVATPPGTAPAESDYRAYWWHLRDLTRRNCGVNRLVEAMEAAAAHADKFRPSVGSIRAHFMANLRWEPQRAVAGKDFVPPTPEQLAIMAEDVREMRERLKASTRDDEGIYHGAIHRAAKWVADYLGGTR